MRKFVMMNMLALGATAATAQTAVGNPPGNTLAPATGAVTTAPAVGASAGDMVAAKSAADLAKIKYQTAPVCKTTIETGSLIAKKKTCLTRKQWQYVNDENERTARRFVEENTTKQGHD